MGTMVSLVVYAHQLKKEKNDLPYHIFEPREVRGDSVPNMLPIDECNTKSLLLRNCLNINCIVE